MSVKAVLDYERNNIGYHEYGKNGTKFGKDFGWNYVSWCAIFQWDSAQHGGEGKVVPKTAGCEEMLAYYTDNHRVTYSWENIERGHIIFWDWNLNHSPNHVEIVESVNTDRHGNVIEAVTIGGNTGPGSNEVARNIRSKTYFEAVGMPLWSNWETCWPGKLLVLGSHNFAVGRLQEKLGGLTVDNDFGTHTLNAVRTFQKNHKLSVDGQVGLNTWGKLF